MPSNVPTVRVTIDFLTLVKLLFAIAGFVFLTQYGVRGRRITGVLLTFPILNGIALLNSSAPFRVAEAVYLLVIFNSGLFWIVISTVRWVPPRGNVFPDHLLLVTRLSAWGFMWAFFAYTLTEIRDWIPTGILLVTYSASACVVTFFSWRRRPTPAEIEAVRSTFWLTWTVRILLFALVFFCILFVAQNASDQKWAGMASALPLPGLFALAALSVTSSEDKLMSIRDSVLLGPFLVIPFNWSFAAVVTSLPTGPLGTITGVLVLVVAWSVALLSVIWLLPILERYLDAAEHL